MKTTKTKDFDAVEFMRQQRIKLSLLLANMTKEEILAYIKKQSTTSTVKPSA